MIVSDYIIEYLAKYTDHIFMLSGGGCMHLIDSLARTEKIKAVPMLHEQAAVIAAEGYSQYTNKLGVAIVTTGPGATNAITGVASAWIDSVPLLVISGQVKTADSMAGTGLRQRGNQEVDIISMVKPITKKAFTVIKDDDSFMEIVKIAMTPRKGPVWLDIPLDIQNAEI